MGNTNPKYKKALIEARPGVEKVQERALCFKYEIERNALTQEDKKSIKKVISEGRAGLEVVLKLADEIPTKEREAIRGIKEQMAVLRGAVEDYKISEATSDNTRILSQRIMNTLENLREFLRWMDKKLEKRWWLKEVLKYLKVLLLMATFLSATLSVVYPELAGPIVTLSFTIASGIVNILEQVLVEGLNPDAVNLLGAVGARPTPEVNGPASNTPSSPNNGAPAMATSPDPLLTRTLASPTPSKDSKDEGCRDIPNGQPLAQVHPYALYTDV